MDLAVEDKNLGQGWYLAGMHIGRSVGDIAQSRRLEGARILMTVGVDEAEFHALFRGCITEGPQAVELIAHHLADAFGAALVVGARHSGMVE